MKLQKTNHKEREQMIKEIVHVGITVSNLEQAKHFYGEVLGLKFVGQLTMEGEETDILFGRPNSKARVAYFNGANEGIVAPPVELIEFTQQDVEACQADLFRTSISEICFGVDDIDLAYRHLVDCGVECLSKPQTFDFTTDGFAKSKALYFKDPDGNILELMQIVK